MSFNGLDRLNFTIAMFLFVGRRFTALSQLVSLLAAEIHHDGIICNSEAGLNATRLQHN